jgi:hypothetical protein
MYKTIIYNGQIWQRIESLSKAYAMWTKADYTPHYMTEGIMTYTFEAVATADDLDSLYVDGGYAWVMLSDEVVLEHCVNELERNNIAVYTIHPSRVNRHKECTDAAAMDILRNALYSDEVSSAIESQIKNLINKIK